MRILHIITSLRAGGAEKLLLESIPMYVEEGIIVDLLLLDGEDSIFLQSLKKLNICNIYTFNISIYNPLLIFKIRRYLKKYDIVHVHLFPTLYWVSLAKYLSKSISKLVYTEHNTYNKRRNKIWLRPLEKFIYQKYNKIICISEKTKENLKKWLGDIDNRKYLVVNNGINLERYNRAIPFDKTLLGISSNTRIILMTARFNVQKDPNTLIRAFNKLAEQDIYLLFVGDGILRKESENLAKVLNVENRVLFLGIRDDVPELIKMSDICVLSSNWEGFGLVAVEYMAAQRPAVVSDVDGLRDIVNGAGIVFEKGNEDDLKYKLELLLNNELMYNEISEKCYNRALNFGIDKMVNTYINVYKDVL